MNQDSRTSDDESVYLLVRQYDEAVAHGASRSPVDESASSLKHSKAEELERLCQCVTLLEQVRRGRDSRPARSTMLFNGHEVALQLGEAEQRIGRFELRGEIGRGGCGIVFRAYDATLDRDVALKIPLPEALVSNELRDRFLREARAAGSLDHPNVVPIYEVGEVGAVCYLASAYVEGPSMATWLGKRQGTVDARQAAQLVAKLADAVEQAHDRGVIHRDIKPGNILLQPREAGTQPSSLSEYTPKLTDFGLAKLHESTDAATRTGMVIGTPAYMAPEQAQGRLNEIGPATDVYALGAILYELLAGQPPLRGESDADTLRRIVTEDPPLVRFARPGIARDIEAISLKCLEKRPTHRYASAAALAGDLRRFLDGRATHACPIGPTRRLVRWSRRRPAIAALLLVCAFSLTALAAGSLVYNARLSDALSTAETQRKRAENESLTSRRLLYSADVRLAYDAWATLNRTRTLELLSRHIPQQGQSDLREFAWSWLWGQCHAEVRSLVGHTDEVFSVAFSPDGSLLATCSKDGTARIWDARTGRALHVLKDHTDEVICVAFSPDGASLATGSEDKRIMFWDPRTGERQFTLSGHEDHVLTVAFSPDGKQLASGGRDGCVRVWNLESREPLRVLEEPQKTVGGVRYSPDGRLLAACDSTGVIHWWGTDDWKSRRPVSDTNAPLFAIDFCSDSQHVIAAGRDGRLYYWNLGDRTYVRFKALENHGNWIRDATLSPDGGIAATCNHNGFVRLWDITRPPKQGDDRLLAAIPGHAGRIWGLDWSPDGNTLATASADRTVKLWNVADYVKPSPYDQLDGWVWNVAFTDDSKTLVTVTRSGRIQSWDVNSRTLVNSCQQARGDRSRSSLAITSDGRFAATATADSPQVRFQNLDFQKVLFELGGYPGGVWALDISPDEKLLAIAAEDSSATILDLPSGELRHVLQQPSGVGSVAFSPDGRNLLTACRALTLWDVRTGTTVWAERYGESDPRTPAFSPDGAIVAVSIGNNRVALVDATNGKRLGSLLSTQGRGDCLAFSPDGNTLAVGVVESSIITLWDVRTHQELCVLKAGLGALFAIAFSPDGKRLVAAGNSRGGENPPAGSGRVVEWAVGRAAPPRGTTIRLP